MLETPGIVSDFQILVEEFRHLTVSNIKYHSNPHPIHLVINLCFLYYFLNISSLALWRSFPFKKHVSSSSFTQYHITLLVFIYVLQNLILTVYSPQWHTSPPATKHKCCVFPYELLLLLHLFSAFVPGFVSFSFSSFLLSYLSCCKYPAFVAFLLKG